MSEQIIKPIEEITKDIVNDENQDKSLSDLEEMKVEETNSDKKDESTEERSVTLKLGDVIYIVDPTNEILNEKTFLIKYIDPTKVKLIDSDTLNEIVLQISDDGIIGDGTIQSITIISSNPENGYARQNELLPGTWINIYFGGEIPTVITGKITNLEEDMIEITTVDKDVLYINFNYQGIPEDIPIETFEIRPPVETPAVLELAVPELAVPEEEQQNPDLEEGEIYEEVKPVKVPIAEVKEQTKRLFFDMDDLDFGESINVEEYVNIDRDKYRYSIEAQTNDMLEEMISNVPNNKRTASVLNNIHTIITRFIQLRKISSVFDKNNNVISIIKHTPEDRPLAEYLASFKNTLYWIMMVAKNVKKIYSDFENLNNSNYRKDDYEMINQNDNMLELETLFQNYRSNNSTEGQNKYSNLYQSVDSYMTPFYSLNSETVQTAFNVPNGIIIEGNVETEINAIIDNLGELQSTILNRSEIRNRKFVIQRYNLGLDRLEPDNLKGQNMIAHRVKLTNNDPISINSIITLPEPTVRFSQINLPGTSLLVKANLNMHFLNYWQLLKQKTKYTKIVIDGLDNELEYDENNFVDNIKQYFLDLTDYDSNTELTNLDIYKSFLQTIIPKIRILFILVKKYIKGKLSLVDVVSYLEPFLIYPIDLTFMQYRDINSFIYEKIKEYNILFKENSVAFSSLKFQFRNKNGLDVPYYFSNPLYSIFGDGREEEQIRSQIFETYGYFDNKMTISGSEFLRNVIASDYGELYNSAVALNNVKLMYPSNLSSLFDKDSEKLKTIVENDKKEDKCSSMVIAKKYYSEKAIENDNNTQIYFDKSFDTTNYEIVEQKYKKQRNELSTEDFIIFLTDEFMQKKMDETTAEYMATTLANQAKQVRDGDYAILVVTDNANGQEYPDKLAYYVRKNNTWVLDNDVDPSTFIKDDDVMCNMDYQCMYNVTSKSDDKCESTEVTKDTIVQNALKQIIDQFDKNYDISKQELQSQIVSQFDYFVKTFDRLQEIKRNEFLKYNNKFYKLGLSISDEIKNVVMSPYRKLRDLILSQNDFVKKQSDILRFVSLYCRIGDPEIPNIVDGEMENDWWFYCTETNTKLLPKFYYILASTYIENPSKYDDVLNELKRTIGKISDDGDSWVDVNSGEVICLIDFDVSEGYKDGFVNVSRDILEKDIADVMLEKQKQDKMSKRLSVEGELVSNVISAMANNMGIDIEGLRSKIIKVVTELMNDTTVIEKEPAYKKRQEEAAKKGKKIQSYSFVYSSTLLYLTLGMYLIAIQTSIPPIKTRKTAPGCVRSFVGFPFAGEGDDSALNYVACVAIKSRDATTVPWNVLQKNTEKTVGLIKNFIIRYLINYPEVVELINEKTTWLLTNVDQDIPDEYNLNKWTNFLPPLRKFHVPNLQNVSNSFNDELYNDITSGSKHQLEKLLVVQSKIISFSLAIQECIQKIVEKKDLLLVSSGKFFMDNACCNENGSYSMTSLQYFAEEDNSINVYNEIVYHLSKLMKDIKILTTSAIMLSTVNTKRKFPSITTDFSEETIYQSFITFCKFQSSIPLSEELASICVDKPDYLKKMDPIQEKIAKMKRDGRTYTVEQFLRLFQIVSRNNIIKMSFNNPTITCVDHMKKLLDFFDEENYENVPSNLATYLTYLADNYDVTLEEDTKEMRKTKDYLQNSISSMRKEIIEFIEKKGRVNSLQLTNIKNILNNLSVWRSDQLKRNEDIKIYDDALYNYINFFKNFISLFSIVFPSMILKEKYQQIEPPKYWGLSRDHVNDVKNMVENFYEPLNKFYGKKSIKNALNEIIIKCKGFHLLSQLTPILTTIKIGEQEKYGVFDKRTTTLLYEFYFLSILTKYVELTNDPAMVNRLLVDKDNIQDDLFSDDYGSQEIDFTSEEQEMLAGNVMELKQDIASLLISYLTIMGKSKKTIDVSYDDVQDKVFKLKEAEKYTFTDKLKDMTDEERAVDTILKHHKLGPLYSLGLSKGIREYDPDHFDHDKIVAEKVAEIQNRLRRHRGAQGDDLDIDDAIDEMNADREIDMDNILNPNNPGILDGDPFGDEYDADDAEYDNY